MMMINNQSYPVPDQWEGATLLSFLRDYLGFMGTKFGCGLGLCGACTVHIDGEAIKACTILVRDLEEKSVTTIEGLASAEQLHPVQAAWKACSVPQCGYCQPGQIMAAAAFLYANPDPSADEVAEAMSGNICRCGTYKRINEGVLKAAQFINAGKES